MLLLPRRHGQGVLGEPHALVNKVDQDQERTDISLYPPHGPSQTCEHVCIHASTGEMRALEQTQKVCLSAREQMQACGAKTLCEDTTLLPIHMHCVVMENLHPTGQSGSLAAPALEKLLCGHQETTLRMSLFQSRKLKSKPV